MASSLEILISNLFAYTEDKISNIFLGQIRVVQYFQYIKILFSKEFNIFPHVSNSISFWRKIGNYKTQDAIYFKILRHCS